MTNFSLSTQQQKLEKIYGKSSIALYLATKFTQHLKTTLNWTIHHLTQANEPRIWVRQNANGVKQFNAYDPRTQKRFCGDSESDLRTWLEARYNS
ncbi:hypothetical protein [Spirulina major]|uniref:hypothetical protein n=1 Tax=Spirulina major TaxID=270636 RepID=UPI0009349DD8|nr:hypothetical protein [Spirulina major]